MSSRHKKVSPSAVPGGSVHGGVHTKQTTLFQTWGYNNVPKTLAPTAQQATAAAGSTSSSVAKVCGGGAAGSNRVEEIELFDDDDDAMLNQAMEMSMNQYKLEQESRRNNSSDGGSSADLFGAASSSSTSPLHQSTSATALESLPGFDHDAGKTWVYPVNYPLREYQYSIVESCLYKNTLVVLPTGLGKTFIAAVVMYNFFQWYPGSKLVFMAPTKPLVAQQIEACFNIMGIPQEETMEMTGNVSVKVREGAWKHKRVLFMTPQVMSNDLSRGLFPASEVKLLVVDEAHRAQGEYAYCQVVRELQKCKTQFRVVALSATPGKDIQAVRQVLQNLQISHIELRNEESPDIVPYTFQRQIEKVVVPLGPEIEALRAKFLTVVDPFINRLSKLPGCGRSNYSMFTWLKARDEFRKNPPRNMDRAQQGNIEGDFYSTTSLCHALELLMQHGMRAFFNFMNRSVIAAPKDGGSGNWKLRYELTKHPAWLEIAEELKRKFADDADHSRLNSSAPRVVTQFDPTQNTQGEEAEERPFVAGHPKLERLRDMVHEHFTRKQAEGVQTRVMIFSQYRDSVIEIVACLHTFKPLIKAMEFIGQAGIKGKKGLTQKQQIEVVRRFREGGYNTLVSTCVGEEGLDIGEVDLIVCYDASKSPIRLVQRMGRTGRKRAGRIIVLVSEGKEDQTYNQSMYFKNSINKAILEKQKLVDFLTPSPRLVPLGLKPACLKMTMTVRSFVNEKKAGKGKSKAAAEEAKNNNRRISGMLVKIGEESEGKKKGRKRKKDAAFVPADERMDFFAPADRSMTSPSPPPAWDEDGNDILFDAEFEVLQNLAKKLDTTVELVVKEDDDGEERFPSWLFGGDEEEHKSVFNLRPAPKPVEVTFSDDVIAAFDFEEALRGKRRSSKCQTVGGEKRISWQQQLEQRDIQRELEELPDDVFEEEFNFDVSEMCDKVSSAAVSAVSEGAVAISPVLPTKFADKMRMHLLRQTSTPKRSSSFSPRNLPPLPTETANSRRNKDLTAAAAAEKADDESCYRLLFEDSGSFGEIKGASAGENMDMGAGGGSSHSRSKQEARDLSQMGRALLADSSGFDNIICGAEEKAAGKKNDAEWENAANESRLYSATQLASMLNESSNCGGSGERGEASGGTGNEARKAQMSDADLFCSDDDDVYLHFDDNNLMPVKEEEEKSPVVVAATAVPAAAAVDSFKMPSLSVFESAKTPPAKKFHFKLNVLSDRKDGSSSREQSPLLQPARKRLAKALDSSGEEVKLDQTKKRLSDQSDVGNNDDDDDSSFELAPQKGRRKNLAARFIETQAELSHVDGSDFSADEDESGLNCYEGSFVDDATQPRSNNQTAMYLKSVKSPIVKSKDRRLRPITADIFSQQVMSEDDDYEADSFCVNSEEEEEEFQTQHDTLDLIEDATRVKPKRRRIANAMLSSSEDENDAVLKTPPLPAPPPPGEKSDVDSINASREARLRKQREMQMKFRSSMMVGAEIERSGESSNIQPPPPKEAAAATAAISPGVPTAPGVTKNSILVSSTEVHKVAELISCLKHEHSLSVHVRFLKGAGFMVSPRMGVDRWMLGDFFSGTNRKSLIERCQMMNDLFERPCLIVETDKPSEEGGVVPLCVHTVGVQRSKYVATVMAQLSQSKIRLLFTDNQEQSAGVLASLLRRECKRGFELPRSFLPKDEKLLLFYQSLPGVELGTALVLASKFASLRGFVSCSPVTLMSRANMEETKARKICEYLRRTYRPELALL